METKTNSHWRKVMGTTFLSGDELEENGNVVTIESYNEEKFFSPKSKSQEDHVVLKFEQIAKPMILTNRKAKQISKTLSTPQMNDWIGKTITIYPNQEKHFGEYFKVINIKAGEIQKEYLGKKHPKWKIACDKLSNGTLTIESIEKHYSISSNVKKQLTNLIKNK